MTKNTQKSTPKQPKFGSLLDVVKRFPDEKSCRDFIIAYRWRKGIKCVHCGSLRKIYPINDGKLLKCADCRKQFTVRIGTIFEDSALPLQKWFMALYLLTAHKKGISSVQLGKDIGVTQKTAWFMLHRIRYAIRTRQFSEPLDGIVEVDETYIGGKATNQSTGRGTANKTAVFGIAQRDGKVIAETVDRVTKKNLQRVMRKNISPEACIMSDEFKSYSGVLDSFDSHETVNHSEGEYVRGHVHTNTIENFWGLLKRGITGIYHHVSKKHLDKYVDEFEFRHNLRKLTDPRKFSVAVTMLGGRLTYRTLTATH